MTWRRVLVGGALGLLALVWGTQYLVIRVAQTDLPPWRAVALRFAVVALIGQLAVLRQGVAAPPGKRALRLAMGATQALSMGLLYGGQARVPSALASVLMSLTPLFVVFIARRWLAEPLHARTLVASASGLLGVLLLSGARSADALDSLGIALIVAAALASAVSKSVGEAIAELPVAVLLRDLGVVVATSAVAISLATEQGAGWTFEPIEILAAIYLGAVPSTAANTVYFLVLRDVEVSRLSYLQVVSATIGLASGVLVAGERLGGSAALGVALVLAGAAFHAARGAPRAATRE